MQEQPDARNLLATARDALLKSLLPSLPPERHYEARMVANAMAIAARSLDAAPVKVDVAALARRIRKERPAPKDAGYDATQAQLWELVRARCAVSAPRAC